MEAIPIPISILCFFEGLKSFLRLKNKGVNMIKEIKARFSKGVIEPSEKLDLEEGEELKITISKKKSVTEALRKTFGGWKDLIDAEELKKNIRYENFRFHP